MLPPFARDHLEAPQLVTTVRDAQRARRGLVSLTALGCLAVLIALVVVAHRAGERRIEAHLSSVLGLPVTVANWSPTLPAGLRLDGVHIGRRLTVDHIDVEVRAQWVWPPKIGRVRLVRPQLKVFEREQETMAAKDRQRPSRSRPHPAKAKAEAWSRLSRLWHAVEVENGTITFQRRLHGMRIRWHSEGVFLHPLRPEVVRVVLGSTTILANGSWIARIGATALDLDRRSRWPLRAAALDASLSVLNGNGPVIHLLVARMTGSRGGYTALVKAAVGDSQRPRLVVRARGKPLALPHIVELAADDVSLDPLLPLLRGWGIKKASGVVNGLTQLTRNKAGNWELDSELRLRDLTVQQPRLASRAVGPTAATITTRLNYDPQSRHLAVDQLRFRSGVKTSLSVEIDGEVLLGSGSPQLSLRLRVPQLACQDLLESLPGGFAPYLEGMRAAGQIGAHGRLELEGGRLDQGVADLNLDPMTCRVLIDPPRADTRTLNRPFELTLGDAHGRPLRWAIGPSNPYFRALNRLSPHLQGAFVVAEDTHFFGHDGFDTKQIRRAFFFNLEEGRFLRGASTISQQLIKNAFLSHARTFSRKFQEAVLTWRMEQVVSKKRILEAYLNLVEMGPGIYGVEQAAERYFGTSARTLTPLQAVYLAALTPSPRPLARRFARHGVDANWMRRLRMLLRLMERSGSITAETREHWARRALVLQPNAL